MNELELFVALNEQAETVKAEGRKVAVILEGRDSAGKSGTLQTVFGGGTDEVTRWIRPLFSGAALLS